MDSREIALGIEAGERGNSTLKIFGPNLKKKEYTVVINKSKKSDGKFAKVLAEEIIAPLLDLFISGIRWGQILQNNGQIREKTYSCDKCQKKFVSDRNLIAHTLKFHEEIAVDQKQAANDKVLEQSVVRWSDSETDQFLLTFSCDSFSHISENDDNLKGINETFIK